MDSPKASGFAIQAGQSAKEIMSNMDKITWDRIGDLSLENSRRNLQYLHYGKSLADLPSQPIGEKDTALIVASGPSMGFHQ